MKLRKSSTFRLILACEDPDKQLDIRTTYPHEAERAHYVPLYPGNLEQRVRMQMDGKMNVPRPCEDYVDTLVAEYEEKLSRGEKLFQFVFENYVYYEDYEDAAEPSRPQYEWVDDVPDDHVTVSEASRDKDVDKSTVNSAIYSGRLNAVMHSGKRYIPTNDEYEGWSPSRKKSYLRDRRLIIAKEILLNEEPLRIKDLYRRIYEIEAERFGVAQLPEGGAEGIRSFFSDVLADGPTHLAPESVWEWQHVIDELVDAFGLSSEKRLARAFPEELFDQIIERASAMADEKKAGKTAEEFTSRRDERAANPSPALTDDSRRTTAK
jgi:hypothetical protein